MKCSLCEQEARYSTNQQGLEYLCDDCIQTFFEEYYDEEMDKELGCEFNDCYEVTLIS